jgi:hypothetical protein
MYLNISGSIFMRLHEFFLLMMLTMLIIICVATDIEHLQYRTFRFLQSFLAELSIPLQIVLD